MRKAAFAYILCLLTLVLPAQLWAADPPPPPIPVIEAGASQNHFYIEPSFGGMSFVLFGAVDREKLRDKPFDIAITIRGPVRPVTLWQKRRRAGIWVNAEDATFDAIPSYYTVISNKPVAELASKEQRKPNEIGLDVINLGIQPANQASWQEAEPEYYEAIVRLKKSDGSFSEKIGGIEFLGQSLFRAQAFLPASAATGLYRANIFVIQNGAVIAKSTAHVRLQKIGLERFLSSLSVSHPWIYGLLAVLMAVVFGASGSLIFRRP